MVQLNNNNGKQTVANICYTGLAELFLPQQARALADSKPLALSARTLMTHRRLATGQQLAAGGGGAFRNQFFENQYLILVFRLALAGTFLTSSFGKLVDIRHYSVAMVYNFNLLPEPLAVVFGWAVPFIELACAVGLLFGVLTRLSALGIAMMSTSFFIAKVILLSRGVDVECGCFGAVVSTMASWSIYLDPIIVLLSATVLFSSQRSRQWVSFKGKLPEKQRINLLRGGYYGATEQ
jgi:uncharacterized membrane protein YphA (DoxX/SURF4 family)